MQRKINPTSHRSRPLSYLITFKNVLRKEAPYQILIQMAQSVVQGNYFLSKKNSMRLLYILFAKKNKHPLQECQYAREVGISRWERHGSNSCALVKLLKVAPTV